MPNAIVNVGKWSSNKETLWGMIKVCNELGFKDFNTILLVNFILFPRHNYKTLFFSCSFDIRLLPKDAITKLTNTDLLCVKNTAQKQKPASPLEDIHGKSGVILLCLFKSVPNIVSASSVTLIIEDLHLIPILYCLTHVPNWSVFPVIMQWLVLKSRRKKNFMIAEDKAFILFKPFKPATSYSNWRN